VNSLDRSDKNVKKASSSKTPMNVPVSRPPAKSRATSSNTNVQKKRKKEDEDEDEEEPNVKSMSSSKMDVDIQATPRNASLRSNSKRALSFEKPPCAEDPLSSEKPSYLEDRLDFIDLTGDSEDEDNKNDEKGFQQVHEDEDEEESILDKDENKDEDYVDKGDRDDDEDDVDDDYDDNNGDEEIIERYFHRLNYDCGREEGAEEGPEGIGCDLCFGVGPTKKFWPSCRRGRVFKHGTALCSKIGQRSNICFIDSGDERLKGDIETIVTAILASNAHLKRSTLLDVKKHLCNMLKWFEGDVRRFSDKNEVFGYILKYKEWLDEGKISATTMRHTAMQASWTVEAVSEHYRQKMLSHNFVHLVDTIAQCLRVPKTRAALTGGNFRVIGEMVQKAAADYKPYPLLYKIAEVKPYCTHDV
jgi:hypothetical protein